MQKCHYERSVLSFKLDCIENFFFSWISIRNKNQEILHDITPGKHVEIHCSYNIRDIHELKLFLKVVCDLVASFKFPNKEQPAHVSSNNNISCLIGA